MGGVIAAGGVFGGTGLGEDIGLEEDVELGEDEGHVKAVCIFGSGCGDVEVCVDVANPDVTGDE